MSARRLLWVMNGGLNLTIPLGGSAGQHGPVSAQTVLVMNSKGFLVSGGQWRKRVRRCPVESLPGGSCGLL
jgi:hypothetical protein